MNQLALSPDGEWALLWHDPDAVTTDDPDAFGVTSYSEISVVNLKDATHHPLIVGQLPKRVRFTPDGDTAVVVSDEKLAILDLSKATPSTEFVEISDEVVPPDALEVVLAPDGASAFVRQYAVKEILWVDLDNRSVTPINVGKDVSDMDLTPDGTELLVVARGNRQVRVLQVADPTGAQERLDLPGSALLGSIVVAPDGEHAAVFTTATATGELVVWDLDDDSFSLRLLPKAPSSAAISPTGETLMVFHDKGSLATTPAALQGRYALSLYEPRQPRQEQRARLRQPGHRVRQQRRGRPGLPHPRAQLLPRGDRLRHAHSR